MNRLKSVILTLVLSMNFVVQSCEMDDLNAFFSSDEIEALIGELNIKARDEDKKVYKIARNSKCQQSEASRAARRKANQKYNASEKGKAAALRAKLKKAAQKNSRIPLDSTIGIVDQSELVCNSKACAIPADVDLFVSDDEQSESVDDFAAEIADLLGDGEFYE